MKRKILFSLVLIIIFAGVMIITDNVKASDIESLQPAEQIVYSETLYVPSVHIGGTGGEGGVTYFNGSIVNASEGDVPVTFGDDVRIDGMLWRGPSKGTSDGQPLKIADTLMPALTNVNDIGTDANRWRHAYLSGNMEVDGDLQVGGNISWGERTSYVNIPSASFVPINNLTNYTNGGFILGGTGFYVAAAILPHNARVTRVDIYWNDVDAGNDLRLDLQRIINDTPSTSPTQQLASLTSSGSGGSGNSSDTSIQRAIIDNNQYKYILALNLTSNLMSIYNIKITYSFTKPY